MADQETVERSREMIMQIRDMCDEAEHMLHQNELNYAEALSFGDQVVILGNALRESVARQMETPDPDKIPAGLKNLPVAMIKKGLDRLAQPYRDSVRRYISIDVAGLRKEQVERVFQTFEDNTTPEWKSMPTEEKEDKLNQLIGDMRAENELAKADPRVPS